MAMAPCVSTAASVSFPARPAGAPSSSARASAGVARASAAAAAAGGGVGNGGAKWWAPLLGWSGKADYIEAPAPVAAKDEAAAAARGRAFVGGLTEEKARELRARMAQTESFHDAMYHSAIASRLARSS